MAARCAPMRGASATTVTSAFMSFSPAAAIFCATALRKVRLSAPR